MRFTTRHLLVVIMIIAAILAAAISVKSAIAPRFVVSVDHPNGSRLRVVQTFSGDDLFNTSMYFDDGDGRWRWYYFDHDDWYWGSADSKVLGTIVHINSDDREIAFNVESGECTILSREVGNRTTSKSTEFRELPEQLADASRESQNRPDEQDNTTQSRSRAF